MTTHRPWLGISTRDWSINSDTPHVEEDFEFGKDHFGLDHSQARLYTALLRHIVLAMAALAVCAITAAQAKTRAPAPILPTTPD